MSERPDFDLVRLVCDSSTPVGEVLLFIYFWLRFCFWVPLEAFGAFRGSG
jgi:hypothetical protein